jgi:hypothetical protein
MPDVIKTSIDVDSTRHVALEEMEPRDVGQMDQILGRAGNQIIEGDHLVAICQQDIAQM